MARGAPSGKSCWVAPSDANSNARGGRVAVVLPGGGVRGAYEIGALSVLLPVLAERGESPTIVCGTSVGAINAALLASVADEPVERQVEIMLEGWRAMRKGDVISPIVGPRALLTVLRMAGEILELPYLRLRGLLDPSPMRGSVERWVDWLALHRNVKRGQIEAVCVVATALSSGSSVAFVEAGRRLPESGLRDDLRYVGVTLGGEHVRASAAIPLLFPAVEITEPRRARDHYIDGGTRLNSPIKPALALGAERVIVIGFEPFGSAAAPLVTPSAPRMADVAANILDGLLVDRVGNDLRRLAAINSFFVDSVGAGPSRAARAYRTARGHAPYRKISYALVGPAHHGELGRLAERIFGERYGGLRGLRDLDYMLMSRMFGGSARSRGELLSFLLFDPQFIEELIACGRRDAEHWLARHPNFWCSDAHHDLDIDPFDRTRVSEEQALDEFRELHRR
jgi:NTE family protein